MAAAKRGLGKGLDAMIPAKKTVAKAKPVVENHVEGQVQNVNITKVEPNRNQPHCGREMARSRF